MSDASNPSHVLKSTDRDEDFFLGSFKRLGIPIDDPVG